MIRRTLGDVKQTIALAIGTCVTDPMIVEYVNQATETMMNRGKWVGTFQRYRICADHTGCITWPRQIETIEAWGMCGCPGIIRNQWFEFDQNGPGLAESSSDIGMQMLDHGSACTFSEIRGTANKKIKVYADVAEDADAVITIQGYDENAQWIRTFVLGSWIDGEQVAIVSGAPVTSTNTFTSITGVLKPETNGPVRLYELNSTNLVQRPIAVYEPSETRPIYRRSLVPNLGSTASCCTDDDEECPTKQVTVMAKLQYLPVAIDNDWLLISNIMALKWMIKSIVKAEQNLVTDSELYDRKAMKLLQEELATYEGDGVVVNVRFQNNQTFGAGAVMNVI